jgi:hypothetical protein
VIKMLDHAKTLGLLSEVKDEGKFWDGRDVKSLAEEVGEWNRFIAAFVGGLKDLLGGDFVAPITEFPDFEHLETEGQDGR